MTTMIDEYTSTGSKLFFHQEAMRKLQNSRGQCITTHIMCTDLCQHKCAFCSVSTREGNTLRFAEITGYLDILQRFGLKATIISGGGNPLLYKCPETGANLAAVVDEIHRRGLQIGLITNGMPLRSFGERTSWPTLPPASLDKCTWVRISMSGLDHPENTVYVPDIDPQRTTLGFSYVFSDCHEEPGDHHHGQVSRPADFVTLDRSRLRSVYADDRVPELIERIGAYVKQHRPAYVRMLPNCLEVDRISDRCATLQTAANTINAAVGGSPVFVQYKPPAAPKACWLGYVHPVLNSDGYVLPCDSCCLNESAGHKLGEAWRICHWTEIASIYERPIKSLIEDPKTLCPGCVFSRSNAILDDVVNGRIDPRPPATEPVHANFI